MLIPCISCHDYSDFNIFDDFETRIKMHSRMHAPNTSLAKKQDKLKLKFKNVSEKMIKKVIFKSKFR